MSSSPATFTIKINPGAAYPVRRIKFWNYSQGGYEVARRMGSTLIEVGDGTSWTGITKTLTPCPAGTGNTEAVSDIITIPGTSGQYVRISSSDTSSVGGAHDSSWPMGLALVQIFADQGGAGASIASDYALNRWIGDVKRLPNTSNTILALEGTTGIIDCRVVTGSATLTQSAANTNYGTTAVANRHPGNFMNVVFADGHVTGYLLADLSPATALSSNWQPDQ